MFIALTSLYRSLLRAHRRLPPDMRSLGDVYVKSGMLSVPAVVPG